MKTSFQASFRLESPIFGFPTDLFLYIPTIIVGKLPLKMILLAIYSILILINYLSLFKVQF